MMVVLTHAFGHPYVDGVGYGVIQSILDRQMTAAGLLALLFVLKLLATTDQPRLRRLRRHLLALALPRRDARRRLRRRRRHHPAACRLDRPSAAIVGMAAMVGAGTGGVMTAIVMVFEMTRDYAIIVPVIVAVAVAAGVRRALIGETIYTIKLRHRGHRIPKERHINLYLVAAGAGHHGAAFHPRQGRHVAARTRSAPTTPTTCAPIIVEREGRIVGLVPPRSGLWRESREQSGPAGRPLCRDPGRCICRDTDLLSLVLARLKRHRAGAAIVFHGADRPRARDSSASSPSARSPTR